MRLFLLRHAQANDIWPDSERILTQKGRNQVKKLCRYLDKSNFENVVQIWHSPYLRALETAQIFKEQMQLSAPLSETANITPNDNPHEAARMIASISCFGGDLVIVSHNPVLENLCDLILYGQKEGGKTVFRKCALAALTLVEPPSPADEYGIWTLNFLLSPSLFSDDGSPE